MGQYSWVYMNPVGHYPVGVHFLSKATHSAKPHTLSKPNKQGLRTLEEPHDNEEREMQRLEVTCHHVIHMRPFAGQSPKFAARRGPSFKCDVSSMRKALSRAILGCIVPAFYKDWRIIRSHHQHQHPQSIAIYKRPTRIQLGVSVRPVN